jgi:hypothetical protein
MKKNNYISPYIDFYSKENILPVKQNIKNFKAFYSKRNYLYKTLGIPLSLLKKKNIIEFGPGGGFNATATSNYKPNLYTFVDANKESINLIKSKILQKKIKLSKYKIIKKNIFHLKQKKIKNNFYDLVIAEGIINCQIEAEKMTRIISNHVKKGGILIVTSNTNASLLSELCRKILALKIKIEEKTFNKKIYFNKICKLFNSHIKTLNIKTRTIQDWVNDNIIQHIKFGKYKFDLEDYIRILEKKFVFYGSSPNFFTDYLWYKKFNYKKDRTNYLALKNFKKIEINFLDYRVDPITKYNNFSKLNYYFKQSYKLALQILDKNNLEYLEQFLKSLTKIKSELPSEFNITKKSINEFIVLINNYEKIKTSKNFKSWWGRGQQYLSFIKSDIF